MPTGSANDEIVREMMARGMRTLTGAMILCDQIHHRGRFSIYLHMADGKVPSIYGPTADEPWV